MHSVEKSRFNQLVDNYTDSTTNDAQEILQLKESYPYSQLLHALSARLTKDHGFSIHQTELQLAAVYAADRAVLKSVITTILESAGTTRAPETAAKTVAEPELQRELTTKKNIPAKAATDVPHDVAEEIMEGLHKLHELKHHFEELFIDTTESESKETAPAEDTAKLKPETPKTADKVEPKKVAKSKGPKKSRRQRIIELAKAMQDDEPASDPEPKSAKKKSDPQDGLIDEIATSHEQLAPENDRQKEQFQIIDQFIRLQPTITNAKDKPPLATAGDLSAVKSGEFGDNIVSETLVAILVQQGKKDKAVEVLKKLIWKFPQKKAYFAAQIEELKK